MIYSHFVLQFEFMASEEHHQKIKPFKLGTTWGGWGGGGGPTHQHLKCTTDPGDLQLCSARIRLAFS